MRSKKVPRNPKLHGKIDETMRKKSLSKSFSSRGLVIWNWTKLMYEDYVNDLGSDCNF